jgi:Probable zinc-ribbon domain
MKSGKQRRGEILARRKKLAVKRKAMAKAVELRHAPYRFVAVNPEHLAPNNSYGAPDFVRRGYYVDIPFRCVGCGKEEVWTGTQQKWWYEVAKGFVYTTAKRCRACRGKERERRDEARRIHLEGVARKQNFNKK